jgi:hypothetical protein
MIDGYMWRPETADDVQKAALNGDLVETPSFEVKEALPQPKRNSDVAVDVSAMTPEGGQILVGVAEDANGQPTIPKPIELAGAADRIAQIVSTSVAEVPDYVSKELRLAEDPSRGYLLLDVPASPRAPHMVQVKGEHRYYGRGEKGNRILTEGEVARLYERRERWEVDRDEELQRTMADLPFAPQPHLAYLVGFARPVPPDRELWRRAASGDVAALLSDLAGVARTQRTPYEPSPSFIRIAGNWRRAGSDMYVLDTATGMSAPEADDTLRMSIDVDGRARLFCGRAGERLTHTGPDPTGGMYLLEDVTAGSVAAFAAILGRLLERAGYMGPVDLGVAVLGIEDARSATTLGNHRISRQAYGAPTYTRTVRLAAEALLRPADVAMRLIGDLVEASAGVDYDPFAR